MVLSTRFPLTDFFHARPPVACEPCAHTELPPHPPSPALLSPPPSPNPRAPLLQAFTGSTMDAETSLRFAHDLAVGSPLVRGTSALALGTGQVRTPSELRHCDLGRHLWWHVVVTFKILAVSAESLYTAASHLVLVAPLWPTSSRTGALLCLLPSPVGPGDPATIADPFVMRIACCLVHAPR